MNRVVDIAYRSQHKSDNLQLNEGCQSKGGNAKTNYINKAQPMHALNGVNDECSEVCFNR